MDSAKGDVEAPFYPKNKFLLPKVHEPTKLLSGSIKIKNKGRLNHQVHQEKQNKDGFIGFFGPFVVHRSWCPWW
jgi:hypothetical protein